MRYIGAVGRGRSAAPSGNPRVQQTPLGTALDTDGRRNSEALLTDALSSTVGLVGSSGNIATSYTYQPFGATTTSGAGNTNSYQFTGRENDGTGLYFYRARYYSPTYQRFLGQDPTGFESGTANLYSYAAEAPTHFVDPLASDHAGKNAPVGVAEAQEARYKKGRRKIEPGAV